MRIPTGNFGNVTPQVQPTRVAVSNVGAVGNAVSGFGAAAGQVAEQVQRDQDKADVAATQAILTDLEAKSNDRWENPETGATVTRQGFKSSGVVTDMDKADAGDYEEARKRVPPSQLNYFDAQWKAGQVRRTSTYSGFERAQTEEAQRQQLNATVTSSVEQEASAYDNPMQAGLIRSARKHSIEMYGQARGWSQERIDGAVSEANQKALEQRAQNYAVTNPTGWLNGDFTLVNSSTGELDMRAVGLVESGGKHRNADGSLVTSPAGAQGEFQLMPDTGKELAAKRGVEYNPDDPVQHAQLARDYAGQLSKKYQSETLAGAAYNWGMGNVDKLIAKVGDPRKGEISMADFVKQLPAETRGWLSRYNKNKTGLDPVAVNKIDNIAESQIREQRAALRQQMEPIVNNTFSQLYNGDVPEAMPNAETIMFMYGEKGQQVVKQLDIAIDTARTFQAIQYVTPAEQQAELAKVKPQANDPDYALKLDAYGKLSALVQKSNANIQAQRDSARFNDALISGEKLDPSNKSMQKAADNTPSALNFRINDATTHDAIVQQVNQTGIIPSQVLSSLSAAAVSRNPSAVLPAANLFDAIYKTDPAAVKNMPESQQAYYLNIKSFTDAGADQQWAADKAYELAYNQSEDLKRQFAAEQSTKEYKSDRDSAIDSAVSNMSQLFRWDPSAGDNDPDARAFKRDYQTLYDINYRTSGGNADVAKKRTNAQIKRNWSISEVNGRAQFMKYAPEALYNYGPTGWQAAQWKEEKERLMYGDGVKNPVNVVRNSALGDASMLSIEQPKSKIAGELELVADLSTPHDRRYAIVIRSKDKDGNERIDLYNDKYGVAQRWQPSLEDWEPYQKMLKANEKSDQEKVIRGEMRYDFKAKHRALDEQYQRLHDERMNRVKNYFSWSNE